MDTFEFIAGNQVQNDVHHLIDMFLPQASGSH